MITRSILLSTFSATVALIVIAAAFQDFYRSFSDDKIVLDIDKSDSKKVEKLDSELAKIKEQLSEIVATLDSTSQLTNTDKSAIAISDLQTSMEDLRNKQSRIETIILEDPTKALQLILLQKEIEDIRGDLDSTSFAINSSVERIYDLSKWLLGALAVSILTLSLSNILKAKEKPKNSE